jgi:hypothetical protein
MWETGMPDIVKISNSTMCHFGVSLMHKHFIFGKKCRDPRRKISAKSLIKFWMVVVERKDWRDNTESCGNVKSGLQRRLAAENENRKLQISKANILCCCWISRRAADQTVSLRDWSRTMEFGYLPGSFVTASKTVTKWVLRNECHLFRGAYSFKVKSDHFW